MYISGHRSIGHLAINNTPRCALGGGTCFLSLAFFLDLALSWRLSPRNVYCLVNLSVLSLAVLSYFHLSLSLPRLSFIGLWDFLSALLPIEFNRICRIQFAFLGGESYG